jgi:hypothetical protein
LLILLLLLVIGGGAFLLVYYRNASKPIIESIDPPIGEPGTILRIKGRNFGSQRDDRRVEFDRMVPTTSSYLTWSDTLIEIRIPLYAESSLIRVVTDWGASNARLFMSTALLPVRPDTAGSTTIIPHIESLSAGAGSIGSILTIRGLNFGANRDKSEVLFAWTGTSAFVSVDEAAGQGSISPWDAGGEYIAWSDKEIRVRIPDGAVTGGVMVRTHRGQSDVRFMQIQDMPGTKRFVGRRTYALTNFISISRVQGSAGASLYLWLPFPVSSASQRGVKPLGRSMEALFPDHRGLSAYLLPNLEGDTVYTVSHDFLVQVYGVETDIKADRLKPVPSPQPAIYQTFTAADALVPASEPAIINYVKTVIGRERNHYRMANLLYDSLVLKYQISQGVPHENPAMVFTTGVGDAWSMALLYCAMLRAAGVPALPVAGIVVDDARRAWNHVWTEFYLFGFGWVPVDIALAMGAEIGDFRPPFEDRGMYFGNLDDRHIAFSRGLVRIDPMTPGGKTVTANRRYSLQTISEEAVGNIAGYTTFWSDVEVTGVY